MATKLSQLVSDVSHCLYEIDASGVSFKTFHAGVGPYGEPQLVKLIAEKLNKNLGYCGRATTKRFPDLLIREDWVIEVKIARPFGDNGKVAENWSVNLLHPYPGNTSVIGDCLKLVAYTGPERRVALVIGYEHDPPLIDLSPLFGAFEVIAREIFGIHLSQRSEICRRQLVHPVHQTLRVVAWEVFEQRIELKMTRTNYPGISPYEPIIGFSRAVRAGNMIHVSGTGPVGADDQDAAGQTRRIFAIAEEVLARAGASFKDVVRTRMYLTHAADWESVGRVHGEIFTDIRPAATMVVVAELLNPNWRVEIELDAVLGPATTSAAEGQ